MSNQKDFEKLPVSQSIRRKVEAILGSPLSEKAFADYEAKEVRTRQGLVTHLQAIPGIFEERRRNALKRAEKAAIDLQTAKDRLKQCNDECQEAAMGAYGMELKEGEATREIVLKLREGADHRLADYRFFLDCLRDELISRMEFGTLRQKNYETGEVRSIEISNVKEVTSLRLILEKNKNVLWDWELEALTSAEVTERLQTMGSKLEKPLRQFELKPPRLMNGEVLAPDVPLTKLRLSLMPSIEASKQ
ncbi:MAG: hypothetical protein HY067_09610 [Betaproteobacteria bacterium]|nr:hypothetical protein [Betaproteobacteria bacterium]